MDVRKVIQGFIFIFVLVMGCKTQPQTYEEKSTESFNAYSDEDNENEYSDEDDENEYSDEDDENEYSDEDNNAIEEGNQLAICDYYNPETGFSNTYTLMVYVSDNEIQRINFDNGGWIFVHGAEIDESGETDFYDNEGRNWQCQVH